jgi:dCMP deaminase
MDNTTTSIGLQEDEKFYNDVYKYWRGGRMSNMKEKLEDYLGPFVNTSYFMVAVNIIKASSTVSYSYTKCANEAWDTINSFFPYNIDFDEFMVSLTLFHLIDAGRWKLDEQTTSKSWDKYYYDLCNQVASRSKCYSRAVGAVLVRDKTVICTGYNGPPRNVPVCDKRWDLDTALKNKFKEIFGREPTSDDIKGKCPRKVLGFKSGEGLEWCVAGHGERNALIQAAREGVCTKNSTLYMNCEIPCTPCLVEIINAGVDEIVVTDFAFYDCSAEYLINNSKLKVRIYDFI